MLYCFTQSDIDTIINDHQHLETAQTNTFTAFVLVKLNKGSVSSNSVEDDTLVHFMFKVKYGLLEKSVRAKYTQIGDIDFRCLSEKEITLTSY